MEGTITARQAVIAGTVIGRIEAFRVEVVEAAAIQGSILHHELSIAPTAWIDGPRPWRPVGHFETAPPPLGSNRAPAR